MCLLLIEFPGLPLCVAVGRAKPYPKVILEPSGTPYPKPGLEPSYSSYRQGKAFSAEARSPLTDFGLSCRLLTLWLLERPNHTQKSFWRVKSTFSQSLRIPKNCLLFFLSCFFFVARRRDSRPASAQSDTQNDTETNPRSSTIAVSASRGEWPIRYGTCLPLFVRFVVAPLARLPLFFRFFVIPLAPGVWA